MPFRKLIPPFTLTGTIGGSQKICTLRSSVYNPAVFFYNFARQIALNKSRTIEARASFTEQIIELTTL